MSKYFKITILIIASFFVFNIVLATDFGGKTQTAVGVSCNGVGSVFKITKSNGVSYPYYFWSSKTGIGMNKTAIGYYKRIDTLKCHIDKTPVTVYIIDKIGVSR